jgi:hypothetical protein
MALMSEVKPVSITLAKPNPPTNFPGKIAESYYKVEDDTVFLCDKHGNPVDRYRLSKKLGPGADARIIACALLRQRYSAQSSNSFNRTLVYPKVVY